VDGVVATLKEREEWDLRLSLACLSGRFILEASPLMYILYEFAKPRALVGSPQPWSGCRGERLCSCSAELAFASGEPRRVATDYDVPCAESSNAKRDGRSFADHHPHSLGYSGQPRKRKAFRYTVAGGSMNSISKRCLGTSTGIGGGGWRGGESLRLQQLQDLLVGHEVHNRGGMRKS
jgi:hypothetical protein